MLFPSHPGQQRELRWTTVSLTVFASILLILRLWSTWNNRGWFGIEDVFVVLSGLGLIAMTIVTFLSTVYGFGLPVVEIHKTGGNVSKAIMYFWLSQVFYAMILGTNKLAFLFLYRRIFPTKKFRAVCLVLIVLNAAWAIAFLMVVCFQCTPTARTWDRTIPGHCLLMSIWKWAFSASNFAMDFIILALPFPVIKTLNMSISTRISLSVVFSMGFLICIITMLRMAALPTSLKGTEPTWTSGPTNLWSYVEAAVGVICACLICLRRTFTTWWPKSWKSSFGSRLTGKKDTYGRSRSRSRGMELDDLQVSSSSKGDGHTNKNEVFVGSKNMPSRSSSQEYIIDQIVVTHDVRITSS